MQDVAGQVDNATVALVTAKSMLEGLSKLEQQKDKPAQSKKTKSG